MRTVKTYANILNVQIHSKRFSTKPSVDSITLDIVRGAPDRVRLMFPRSIPVEAFEMQLLFDRPFRGFVRQYALVPADPRIELLADVCIGGQVYTLNLTRKEE